MSIEIRNFNSKENIPTECLLGRIKFELRLYVPTERLINVADALFSLKTQVSLWDTIQNDIIIFFLPMRYSYGIFSS